MPDGNLHDTMRKGKRTGSHTRSVTSEQPPLIARMPANLAEDCATLPGWVRVGEALGEIERSVMWQIGEWWNLGERYGERVRIVQADDWTGPSHGVCREAGRVAARWDVSVRTDTLGYEHHKIVASLPDAEAKPLLEWAAETPEPRSTRDLAARVKQVRRAEREVELAEAIEASSLSVGTQLYGVIYADPPWRFEPYSRDSGMDRAADNHYPTMTAQQLADLELPAADDCVLFCWSTVAMLPAAEAFIKGHGFEYKTAYGWLKPGPGTGYWSQADQLELLLVGTRGDVPAPAPGLQPPQVQIIPRGRHSAKPEEFAAMIETMFPNVPKLEIFARAPRAGWDVWGNEA